MHEELSNVERVMLSNPAVPKRIEREMVFIVDYYDGPQLILFRDENGGKFAAWQYPDMYSLWVAVQLNDEQEQIYQHGEYEDFIKSITEGNRGKRDWMLGIEDWNSGSYVFFWRGGPLGDKELGVKK